MIAISGMNLASYQLYLLALYINELVCRFLGTQDSRLRFNASAVLCCPHSGYAEFEGKTCLGPSYWPRFVKLDADAYCAPGFRDELDPSSNYNLMYVQI